MSAPRNQTRPVRLLVAAALLAAGCHTRANYLHPEGPRSAGTFAVAAARRPEALGDERLRVVSFNLKHGRGVGAAIELWDETPHLGAADVVLLQEMDARGVEAMARALGHEYVYYPASHRKSGRDFGNAILTRGRIVADEKVLLSHVNPVNRQRRIAVRAELELDGRPLHVYSVHTETPVLGLTQRELQIEEILASVPRGAPCLIGGDLNTMSTRSLERFEESFAAAGFEHATEDAGDTLRAGPLGFATDHVFARDLEAVASGTVASPISDHEPLWVDFVWSSLPDATAPPGLAGPAGETPRAERTKVLAPLPDEPTAVRKWMKEHDWVSKRHDPGGFEIGARRMHLRSDGDSVLIGTERGFPARVSEWPRLRFRLRVDQVPTGAGLSTKRTDDAAFRLFVAFDRGGSWFSPPDTIAYTWTADIEPETIVQSPHFKRVKYLSIGSGVTLDHGEDGWVTIERDLAADYARAFGPPGSSGDVPDVEGIALKCDSNNTRGPASAWLSDLELVADGGEL